MRTIKIAILFFIGLLLIGGSFLLYQNHKLTLAHSTFENYYAFRGCIELIDRTDTFAHCKVANGQTIKIVKINNAWYLEGDGPGIW